MCRVSLEKPPVMSTVNESSGVMRSVPRAAPSFALPSSLPVIGFGMSPSNFWKRNVVRPATRSSISQPPVVPSMKAWPSEPISVLTMFSFVPSAGLLTTLIAPAKALRPKVVPCGPRSTSTCSTSRKGAPIAESVVGTPSTERPITLSSEFIAEPSVERPRMVM